MGKTVLYEGPDISVYQGTVDMKRVRDAGCERVGLRAGYGKNNVDQRYIANAQACYNLDVPVVIYWFSYGYNDDMAKTEADYAIAQAAKFWKRCPIAFDLEYDTVRYARTKGVVINKALATEMAIAFLSRVKEKGYIPVLYTNRDYYRNYFDVEKIAAKVGEFYIWYARYELSSLPASEQSIPDIWQYTSKGKLAGVNGNVDMNKFYTNFDLEVEKVEPDKSKATCNINILNFQKAANADGYRDASGNPLAKDGIDGPKTQYVRRKINLKAKRVGLIYKVGSQGVVVKWLQTRCNEILGTGLVVDGKYGSGTRKAVMQLQKKLGLAVDGIAGYNTIQALFYN